MYIITNIIDIKNKTVFEDTIYKAVININNEIKILDKESNSLIDDNIEYIDPIKELLGGKLKQL